MKEPVAKVFAILAKDILTELRTREIITAILVFALLTIVIFHFAFDPSDGSINLAAPGVLWVALVFAGVLGLNRLFAIEKQNSCLEGLIMCPVDSTLIYWGKMCASFLFMFAVAIVVTPIFLALLNFSLFLPHLIIVIVLATVGFAAVGTLFSALAMNTKARDIMLPILMLPVLVPIMIAGVKSTALVLEGQPLADSFIWIQIMVIFDVIYLIAATLIFESAIEQ